MTHTVVGISFGVAFLPPYQSLTDQRSFAKRTGVMGLQPLLALQVVDITFRRFLDTSSAMVLANLIRLSQSMRTGPNGG